MELRLSCHGGGDIWKIRGRCSDHDHGRDDDVVSRLSAVLSLRYTSWVDDAELLQGVSIPTGGITLFSRHTDSMH